MQLISIHLSNIRTYQDQKINLNNGITLLSGDIGSGKSSILLAIEFALFGSSRANLPAEALLRKGTTKASVTLNFQINKNTYQIKRTLSQQKTGIRQGNGHIIENGIKTDLTPIELKAKIINLLSYQEDLITKGKNYIFRYTVYCPQEDMKQILQESPENRLNIFNIEKYKIVRDNLQIYLKEQRKQKTILTTRLEPLNDLKKEKETLEEQTKQTKQQKAQYQEQKTKEADILTKIKQTLESLQKQKDNLITLKNQETNEKTKLEQQTKQKTTLTNKNQEIKTELDSLLIPKDLNQEKLNIEIKRLEQEIEQFNIKKATTNSQIASTQNELKQIKSKLQSNNQSSQTKQELSTEQQQNHNQQQLSTLTQTLKSLETIESDLETLSKQEQTIIISKNNLSLQKTQITEKLSKINDLNNCPTCLQEVTTDHKHQINQEETGKLSKITTELTKTTKQEEEIKQKIQTINQKITKKQEIKDNITKINTNILLLEQKQKQEQELKIQLKNTIQKNNQLMQSLQNISQDEELTIPRMKKQLENLKNTKQKFIKQQELIKFHQKNKEDISNTTNNILEINQNIINIQKNIQETKDPTEDITKTKQNLETQTKSYQEITIQYTKAATEAKNQEQQLQTLTNKITTLNKTKQELTVLSEHLNWLSNYFINLTYTIEKEIMLRIYYRFNDLFITWFTLLTEGSELTARLNAEFTPIIEQSGHQIPFSYLSGGERTAASLAYRLSLNKVINDTIHAIKLQWPLPATRNS